MNGKMRKVGLGNIWTVLRTRFMNYSCKKRKGKIIELRNGKSLKIMLQFQFAFLNHL